MQLVTAAPTVAQAAPGDPIRAENALEGSPASEWDVDGSGDPSIQGFGTDISVNRGATIDFKIDTESSDYRIDVYRLGWYDGDGARKVATIATDQTTETQQPDCELREGAPENLLDCSNWTVSASWSVPADAVSGVYIARPTRQDVSGDLASHIPFVVRDDASTSQVFFQTSDTTWQSYNQYGGYNLYGYQGNQHAHKVSYNRPFQTRGTEPENYLFNSEYPMLRWLERNGYDVSYTTGIDTARRGDLIKNHDLFMSTGHDEYWSQEQRDAVEAARDDGVNLAFFSANEVYWKIRWQDDLRTQVTYKEGNSAPTGAGEHYRCWNDFNCDPSDIWTGQWRQAPGSTPENSLTGQISWRLDTVPMKVPAHFAPLRFWANTSVASLTGGMEETLAPGTVGYEWNPEQAEFADHYPDGRILLSSTTINGEQHNMSLYRAESGALVFGAGTVQWPWGLDDNPSTPQATENRTQQQATANLLADMGALPTSLQTGLVMPTASTDTTAPVVTITSPGEGAEVPGGSVTVSGTATDVGGVVAGVEVSVDEGQTWQRATGTSAWQYTFTKPNAGAATVQVRATDDSVNTGEATTRTFGTATQVCAQDSPCTIFGSVMTGTQEDTDAVAVELGVKFRSDVDGFITGIRFFKTPGNTGLHAGNLWTSTGTNLGTLTFTDESPSGWQQATFQNPVPVTAGTTYVASYHAPNGRYAEGASFTTAFSNPPLQALADGTDGPNGVFLYGSGGFPTDTWQGANYLVDVMFVENAVSEPDVNAPSIVTRSPALNATGVSLGANVTAVFNEALDPATVGSGTVSLSGPGGVVPADVSWVPATRTIRLDPDASLAPGTRYTVTISNAVTDLAGNPLAANATWDFTTATPPVDRSDPNAGPGGPLLLVTGTGSHGTYLAEILRAEGLNLFTVGSRTSLTESGLAEYATLVLAETELTAAEVSAITAWVGGGGNLVAIRPDAALANLLGLTPQSGTLSEGYIKVDNATTAGAGIVGTTMQFHGLADRYAPALGTQVIATLHSDATTATSNPAVTLRVVNDTGATAVAFTYDLAESVVLTRQGNPAWVNQNRDGQAGPNRGNDLFFGGATADWVDLSRVAIPQADEQQRLLANVITDATLRTMPLPRLWYLPRGEKAAVVMTADNHNGGSVPGRFNQEIAASEADCSVEDWECIRSTAYLFPANAHMADAQMNAFEEQGFEVALHPDTGCTSPSAASFATMLADQTTALKDTYPSLDALRTNRNHCIAWIGWTDVPEELVKAGVHLDTNYYFWPPTWVNNTPGLFTGSGFAQRFADEDGQLIDAYQATTQMTDESGQTYPFTAATLLDRALGAEGYYGTFVANIHNDGTSETQNADIIAAAKARNVPVISAEQLLDWTDGRNASSFVDLEYANGTLTFSVDAAAGSNGLQAMVPVEARSGTLTKLTLDGAHVTTSEEVIKGVRYAFFTANAGTYEATYDADTTAPAISAVNATASADGTAVVSWTTDEPATSRVDYGTDAATLSAFADNAASVTSHQVTLHGLTPGNTYYFRVSSTDGAGNSTTEPATAASPLSFVTPDASGPMATDDTVADFAAGFRSGMVVTDTAGGELALAPGVRADFSTGTLPDGWTSTPWNPGGGTSLSGGSAVVDAALLAYGSTSPMYGPGRSIEAVATFGPASFQHIGFAEDMNDVHRWAIFSTNTSNGSLYARTNADGVPVDVAVPGSWIGSEHTYRIDWLTDRVVFSIDGAVVHTQMVTFAGTMRPLASDFATGGASLSINSIQMSPPYVPSGTFESRIHDAGLLADWGTLDYEAEIPTGTALAVEVRSGDSLVPDANWTAYMGVGDGADMPLTGRYVQYRITASTTVPGVTPILWSVNLPYAPAQVISPTATSLSVGTVTPGSVELTATVTPAVAGTTQFRQDGINTGAPVQVADGSATFTVTGLAPETAYAFTAHFTPTDSASHLPSTSAPVTVTTPAIPADPHTDDTVADFTAGTLGGMSVTDVSGGELVLVPAVSTDFGGNALPEGWTSSPWGPSGSTTVTGGSATVDGAILAHGSTEQMYGPGRSLEFVATFGAAGFQHAGFGVDMNDVPRWAIFSTGTSAGPTLFARTNTGGTTTDVAVGDTWLGSEHTYRIEWRPDQVVFFIDGVLVHTQTVAIEGTMRPVASDFAAGGANLAISSMSMSLPYVPSGTFESRIHDAGSFADWGVLEYRADVPVGTTLALAVRGGNTATVDETWSEYVEVAAGADMPVAGRYLQYRVTAATTTPDASPTLFWVDLPNAPAGPAVATTVGVVAGVATHETVGLVATVAPSEAVGSVQFQVDGADVGAAVPVVGGSAAYEATGLSPSTTYSFTATFTPTDPASFEGSISAAVAVTTAPAPDTVPPVITPLGAVEVTVEVGGVFTEPGAIASDNYDEAVVVVFSGSVDTSTVGVYTLTYSATDVAGNAAVPVTRTVRVVDTTAPVITLLGAAEVTVEVGGVFTEPGATASDNYDESVVVVFSGSVDTSTVGTYTLTYNATDTSGNAAFQVTRTVTVTAVPDTTPPVITLLGDAVVSVEVGSAHVDAGASALDDRDGDITAGIVVTGSVDTTTLGDYLLTYGVSDSAGNAAAQVTRTVRVVDTTAPVITLLGDAEVTVEVGGVFTEPGATASDNCDEAVVVVFSGSVDTSTVGVYTLTYSASDVAGNAAVSVTRTVSVVDTTAPVITLTGAAEMSVLVGDAFTDPGATASDNYDEAVVVVFSGSVDTSTVGVYTLTYNATDASGNAAVQVTRTVTVSAVPDTTAPVITLLGDVEVSVEVDSAYVDAGATASDDVDGDVTALIAVTGSVDSTTVGTYTLTYDVSDAAGNAAVPVRRTVRVVDTTAPVITLSGAAEMSILVGGVFTDPGATAMDSGDGDVTSKIERTGSVDTATVGTYTLTYDVSDAAGNEAVSVTRTVHVVDTTAPVITLAGAAEMSVLVGGVFTDPGANAVDNYDKSVVVVASGSVNTSRVGTYTITYDATDAAGNRAVQATRMVTVRMGAWVSTPTPTITGQVRVGSTLSVVPGIWDPVPEALTYQWFRGATAISGATSQTYRLLNVDAGQAITVRTTATRTGYPTESGISRAVTVPTPPTLAPAPPAPVFVPQAPYTLPGLHDVNGRRWFTHCENYSRTTRCFTSIWATTVKFENGNYVRQTGWAFNNLTYLPYMDRAQWAKNPLGFKGEWKAADGRLWRTDCDTPATGRGGCRSYTWATVYTTVSGAAGGYVFNKDNMWVFNNIVMFRQG